MTESYAKHPHEWGSPGQPSSGGAPGWWAGDRRATELPAILVIDDDPDIIALVDEALATRGYRVLASTGAAALHLAREARPATILLDLMMPDPDGYEVCRRLRGDPATAAIPIILMSGDRPLGDVEGALAVDDRLPKPFSLGDLFAAVARWAGWP
jgi:two-component system alkaline phosphatase synthesis response regulator PhoP